MKVEIDSIDAYSSGLNSEGKAAVEQVRLLAAKLIPNCSERMSYGMPSFESNGIIFWFAVWKTHFGLYPKAKALEVLAPKLKNYKTSKGCVQFPSGQALPIKLITEIIKFRLKEHKEELVAKAAKKKASKKTALKKPSVAKTASKTTKKK